MANQPFMLLVQGVVFAVIYYVVFRAVITKFDLPTPGREKEDLDAEMAAVLANDDFTKVAAIILEGLGGKGNVVTLDNCITRLRLEIKRLHISRRRKIKSAGVAGVMRPSKTSVQVIVGTKVQFVADEMQNAIAMSRDKAGQSPVGKNALSLPPGFFRHFYGAKRPTALGTPRRFRAAARRIRPLPYLIPPKRPWPRKGSHPIPPHPSSTPHKIIITQPNPCPLLSPPPQNMLSYNSEHYHLPTHSPPPNPNYPKKRRGATQMKQIIRKRLCIVIPDSHADHPPHQLLHRNPQCPKRNVYQRPGNVLAGRPDTGPKRKEAEKKEKTWKSNVSSGPKQSPTSCRTVPRSPETSRRWKKIARLLQVDEFPLIWTQKAIYTLDPSPKYFGLNYKSGQQMQFFLPMLENYDLQMCQDITPNTAEES